MKPTCLQVTVMQKHSATCPVNSNNIVTQVTWFRRTTVSIKTTTCPPQDVIDRPPACRGHHSRIQTHKQIARKCFKMASRTSCGETEKALYSKQNLLLTTMSVKSNCGRQRHHHRGGVTGSGNRTGTKQRQLITQ